MKGKRFLARLSLLVIAALVVLLLIFAFTGAPESWLLAVLFCLIVVPSVIYVFIHFTGIGRDRRKDGKS